MKPTLLVLAAGMGSRYGSLKQIDKFGPSGETIIDYSIYDALRAGFGKIVFVIRRNIEQEFKESFANKFADKIDIDYALQELDVLPEGISVPEERTKPWGTGHAVLVAAEKINEPFAVINADDFYGAKSFEIIAKYLSNLEKQTQHCMVGYKLSNTLSEYGYVSRGICQKDENDNLTTITERTHISTKGDKIIFEDENGETELKEDDIASMNLMGFSAEALKYFKSDFEDFIKENSKNLKSEFYLPSVVNNIITKKRGTVKVINTPEKWFGVTYKEDKKVAIKRLKELVEEGIYPANLWNKE